MHLVVVSTVQSELSWYNILMRVRNGVVELSCSFCLSVKFESERIVKCRLQNASTSSYINRWHVQQAVCPALCIGI
jgi:hypothetical protein